ncbi:hypothetical protein BIV57_16620 [Mangrovactinospora gilvigrisea]|uniref:Chitin-binding type-4 domain-containing protein n=1 Tax=Mangrovactinospora gilvigrisea TaxID=1428644 RepID=A0A1J7BCH8_9ACTN|nr:lytic polysaccharide monooxygenase [Mangrovactinospora gilvigrisea]OIV36379.1 hypothetical protein BIV57_16620 [Mangrovactinospora gilvigrisea]
MTTLRHLTRAGTAATTAAAALVLAGAGPAAAHGSLGQPVSRVLQCYGENPEHPVSTACRAAVAAGGTQALYDWNAVRLADAAGQSRRKIPDGRLCSAGDDEFKGLDLPRADWPATRVASGAAYTFRFRVTARHKGTFAFYLTKPGYDPAKPLTWAELADRPFLTATDPAVRDGSYVIPGTLPKASGRQLVYVVWQRSDSPEAFYSCSDVDFGGGTAGAASDTAEQPTDRRIAAGAGRSSMKGMTAHGTAHRTLAETGGNSGGNSGGGSGLGSAETPLLGLALMVLGGGAVLYRAAARRRAAATARRRRA